MVTHDDPEAVHFLTAVTASTVESKCGQIRKRLRGGKVPPSMSYMPQRVTCSRCAAAMAERAPVAV